MQIKPISPALGAEIIDLDISKPLDDETVAALRQSLAEHCILVLRNQTLTPEQHITFSRKFGKLAEHVLQDYLLKVKQQAFMVVLEFLIELTDTKIRLKISIQI